jgi:methyl-accepting chemotaxis protein
MADSELGEFRYIVTADYTNLLNGINQIVNSIQAASEQIGKNMEEITNSFSQIGKGLGSNGANSILDGIQTQVKNIGITATDSADKIDAMGKKASGINPAPFTKMDQEIKKVGESALSADKIIGKIGEHINWIISASLSGAAIMAPFKAVSDIAGMEQQMAGMVQVLPQLHGNQQLVNQTATQFIGIAEEYGVEVDKIIEAGKRKLAA